MTTWSRRTPPWLTKVLVRRHPGSGYDAFISYSHAGDARVASILQRSLHGFARSWFRLRALRVFRDTASLSADPSLWAAIERALASTRFLILVASSEAAGSKWVAKEVDWWCSHKSREHLLIVLSEGVVAWSETTDDFDWDKTSALPRVLEGVFTQEPLYVDLRFARGARQLSPRHPELREAVATLAATIHGRPRDELIGEDVRRHRRAIQVAAIAVATIAALGAVAFWQSIVATHQRDRAREQAAIAVSRQLASQADAALKDGRLDVALLLGVTASTYHDTVQSRDVLFRGLQTSPELVAFLDRSPASAVALSQGARRLAIGRVNGTVELWDVATHRRLGEPSPVHGDSVTAVAFSPDGRTIASGAADFRVVVRNLDSGEHREISLTTTVASVFFDATGRRLVAGDKNGRIGVWSVKTARPLGGIPCARGLEVTKLAPAPHLRAVAIGTAEGYVLLCDVTTGTKLWQSPRIGGGIHSLAADRRGLLAAGTERGSIVLWNSGHRRVAVLHGHQAIVSALSFGKRGALASAGLDGAVLYWPAVQQTSGGRGPKAARTLQAGGNQVRDVALGPRGLLVSVGADGATLWNVARRERTAVQLPAAAQSGALTALAFTGTTLASGDASGIVRTRDVRSRQAARRLRLRSAVSALAFSGDGRTLAAGDVGGTVKVWSAATGTVTTLSTPQHERVMGLSLDAAGRALIGGDLHGRLLRWNLSSGDRATLARLDAGILSLAAGPARDTVAVLDGEGKIMLATLHSDSARMSDLGRHEFATQVAYAPDGSFVASAGSDGNIRLWDPSRRSTGRQLLPSVLDSVTGLAFSLDSHLLAASAGSEVRIWDVRAHEALGLPLVRPGAQLFSVVFGMDGMLVTGGLHRSASAWTTDLDTWRSLACATANRTMSEVEWEDFVGAAFAYEPPCSS